MKTGQTGRADEEGTVDARRETGTGSVGLAQGSGTPAATDRTDSPADASPTQVAARRVGSVTEGGNMRMTDRQWEAYVESWKAHSERELSEARQKVAEARAAYFGAKTAKARHKADMALEFWSNKTAFFTNVRPPQREDFAR